MHTYTDRQTDRPTDTQTCIHTAHTHGTAWPCPGMVVPLRRPPAEDRPGGHRRRSPAAGAAARPPRAGTPRA
eukprot:9000460-Pyramimonas_sp.AAC.1